MGMEILGVQFTQNFIAYVNSTTYVHIQQQQQPSYIASTH